MGVDSPLQLRTHPLRGMLFENMIVAEVLKFFQHRGRRPRLSFYRDSAGNEADLVIPHGARYVPLEIKSAETLHDDFFKGLRRFQAAVPEATQGILVYGGAETRVQSGTRVTTLSALPATLAALVQL